MRTERWVPKDQGFEAVRLTMENIHEAAIWCGGEVGKRTQPSTLDNAWDTVLRIPGLAGAVEAGIGTYLIKQKDGKFTSLDHDTITKDYKTVSRREDGWQGAMRGGRIEAGDPPGVGPAMNHDQTVNPAVARVVDDYTGTRGMNYTDHKGNTVVNED